MLQNPASNAAMNLSLQQFLSDQACRGDGEITHIHTHRRSEAEHTDQRDKLWIKGFFFHGD